MLRLVGADLRPVPAVPYKDPNNYVKLSGRLAEELNRASPTGRSGPTSSTMSPTGWGTIGPPARRSGSRPGKVDAFTCAIGTGGTLAGVGLFLKERRPAVRIVAADPMGAALYNWYKHGELKAEGSSISEGIGQGRVTANLEGAPSTMPSRSPTRRPCPTSSTSSSRRAGARRLLGDQHRRRGARGEAAWPGHTIVTILADYGTRYQSKLFNPAFLREKACRSRPGSPDAFRTREPHARRPGQHRLAPDHLEAPDVRVVDATWFLPDGAQRPRRARGGAHPGAVFFDLDAVCEPKGLHPHMVPSAAKFSSRVRKLGLGDGLRWWSTTTTASSPRRGCVAVPVHGP